MISQKELKSLGDSLGRYLMETFVAPRLSRTVSYYRAQVASPASGGKITVQKPFDTAIALPYVSSAAGLKAGDQCIVLVLGDASNAIVLGDGMLSNL